MYQHHARPFSFYLPIPYLYVLRHSVTLLAVNTIMFIETPFDVTHCRSFIHIYSSFLFQYRRRCVTHFFPLFSIWHNIVKKYRYGGMIWEAWLKLSMRDSSLSILFLLITRTIWYQLPSSPPFIWVGIPIVIRYGCPSPDMSCDIWGDLTLIFFIVIGSCSKLEVRRSEVDRIWCGSPVIPGFGIIPPKLSHQWWGWWFHWWIHQLRIPFFQGHF